MLVLETRTGWTSRIIDFQFHKFFWENRYVVPTEEHIHHQIHMLEVVRGHEEENFMDTVIYPFREHFNGSTGTLSNLLSNCFFHIYYAMLIRGIPVNVEADLKTMYTLIYRFNEKIPFSEIEIVQRILQILISCSSSFPFLTKDYYDRYYKLIIRANQELLLPSSTCSFYKENPSDRTLEFLKNRAPYSTEFKLLEEPLPYIFGTCEYTPEYIDLNLHEPFLISMERLKRVEYFLV